MLMLLAILIPIVGAVLVFREADSARRRTLTVVPRSSRSAAFLSRFAAFLEAGCHPPAPERYALPALCAGTG